MIIDWLPEAIRNRFDQLDYIAEDSPNAAADQDDEIERQVNMLHDHPKMGRSGRVKGTRELVISRTPFVAVYRIQADTIQILRLLHSSQQWPNVADIEFSPPSAAIKPKPVDFS